MIRSLDASARRRRGSTARRARRRSGSAPCSTAGTPTPTSTAAPSPRACAAAAAEGARLVCLQELTLSPYFAVDAGRPGRACGVAARAAARRADATSFAAELAARPGVHVHASLYEADAGGGGRGYNTAICVAPDGALAGPHPQAPHPGHRRLLRGPLLPPRATPATPWSPSARRAFGFPTCWDQWFPELARAYSLAGAEVLVYPTAIGSEPDHPDFDTEPLWEQVIVGNGIANGTFMVAVNRIGTERPARRPASPSTARRSSATRTAGCSCRRRVTSRPCSSPTSTSTSAATGSTLFPFLTTRRPDTYGPLTDPRPS